jgi:hypothetical protein
MYMQEAQEEITMTRFEQELSGKLGAFWERHAKEELAQVAKEIENGEITIDDNGVARNYIGRVLMNDMLEKVVMITDKVNVEATRAAREEEVSGRLNELRFEEPSEEELAEQRAVFGEGTRMVNILTGKHYTL